MGSPFEVLGVEPDADEAAVEEAYRRRVKRAHPDAGGSVEEFRRVREAYEAVVSGEATSPSEALAEETVRRSPDGSTATESSAGPRGPDASARAANGAAGAESTPEPPEQTTVEYLNYETLEDHGWALSDEDLFERARAADLDHRDYGRFIAERGEMLLAAAEDSGYGWPYACRGGACANCAVYIAEGDVEITVDNVLTDDLLDQGFRLSCICKPDSERLRVVYNVKHLPGLDELRLPADRFERTWADD